MGTSLSGLTPQTTFDGLLKVGDNDPLTAGLKAISDGSGNDSAIQLSTGELKVMGQFNVDTDTAATEINLRGNSLTINQVYHANENTYNSIQMVNSSGIRLKNGTSTTLAAKGGKVGIGTSDPTEMLHIKGSGADDTTTSLLVQNSAGTQALKVTDDGVTSFGTNSNINATNNKLTIYNIDDSYLKVNSNAGFGTNFTATERVKIQGIGNDNTTTSLLVQNSAGSDLLKVTDDGKLTLGDNGNDGYISILRGLNGAQIGYIEGQSSGVMISMANNSNQLFLSNSGIGIGETTPTARLHVKGTDTSAATTTLLVEKSDGTDLLRVTNGGNIFFGFSTSHYLQSGYNWFGNYSTIGNWKFGTTAAVDGRVVIRGEAPSGDPLNNPIALLVQNSAGTDTFKVDDAGTATATSFKTNAVSFSSNILLSSSGIRLRPTAQSNGGVAISNSATPIANTMCNIKGWGADNTTTALLVQNSDGDELLSIDDIGGVRLGGDGNTTTKANIKLDGYTGLFNVTNAKFGNFNGTAYAVFSGLSKTDALFAFGNDATTASTRMHIKGLGASAGTAALLVQNSAGTDLLKVEDGGDVKIDNGVAADLKVKISATASKYLELDRQGRQVRFYSGATGNAGIFMAQADKFSIGTNNTSLILLDENSNVRIGSGITAANTSAKLQVDSTTQGFLPPRMTTEQKNAITSPAAGLMVYDTDQNQMNYWNSSGWIAF